MTKVLTKINNLKNKITKAQQEICKLQSECSHNTERVKYGVYNTYPDYVKKVHKSDTGNYDPTQDSSWTELHCTLCDKKWIEDGTV